MLRKIDGDVDTLSKIQDILSDEIESSVSSCDSNDTLFVSTADIPDPSTPELLPPSQSSAFVQTNELFSDLSEGSVSDLSEDNLSTTSHNTELNQYVGFIGSLFPPSLLT